MSLGVGSRIGPFEVLARIGEGGMGEVYRAHDSGLKRDVALKVLPALFAGCPDRLARFRREAEILAALSHPHVAGIFGIERADGQHVLVLELIEGQTLARRLESGKLLVGEALDVGRQIAEGLEAAHAKGIVHRDLKPSNIQITPHGTVKILDFGLAKALADEPLGGAALDSTLTETEAGTVVGTTPYMSPEQAMGKPIDARTDVWAFGCVLLECLTGRNPFRAESRAETVARILDSAPDWRALPVGTPAPIKSLLRTCLQKDPNHRLRDIADARVVIADAMATADPWTDTTPDPGKRDRPRRWAAGVMLLGLGLVLGSIGHLLLRPSRDGPSVRSVIPLPQGLELTSVLGFPSHTELALAPDASYLVFSASPDGSVQKAMLYKRPLHRHESRAIEGTVGACVPFVSPDGQWIGFWSNKAIRRIPVDGGSPQTIVQLDEEPFGVDWGDDGHIVFGTREDGLRRVSVSGGPVETLTRIDEGREHTHRLPHVLPGGKALVFSVMPHLSGAESRLELLSRDTRTRTVLLDDAADARYVAPGRLVFVRQGTLMVVAFDLGRLAITGPEAAFSPGVMQSLNRTGGLHNTGAGLYSLSEEGTLAYVPGGRFPDLELRYSWVDRRGHVEPWTSFGTKPVLAGRLSPDNSQLAFSTSGVANRIRLYDVRRDTETTVTTRGSAAFPVWNPGGTHVAFAWSLAGPANIWQASIAETDHMVRLTTSPHVQRASSWSPDGAHLLLVDSHPKDGPGILALHVATGRVTPLVASEYREQYPEVSPDGRWLAYVSNKSGRNEVYVRSFPDGAREEIVSTQGGDAPLWAPDGRELFYWNLDWNALMAVKLAPGSRPSPGRAVELLRFYNRLSAPVRNYDITNDGRRFLIRNWIYPVFKVTEIHLVQNWLSELTQRGLEKP